MTPALQTPGRARLAPLLAKAVVVMLVVQFTAAGLALFQAQGLWVVHATVGSMIALPVFALLVETHRSTQWSGLRWQARGLLLLYLLQVALGAASDSPDLAAVRVAHVANASALLCAATALAVRLRGRARVQGK
jgi:hypothetical protein